MNARNPEYGDRRTNMVDAVGTTAWRYDEAGRLVGESGPFGTLEVQAAYDPNGRLTNVTWGTFSVDYAFDDLDRIVSVAAPEGTYAFTYLSNGIRRATVTPVLKSLYTEAGTFSPALNPNSNKKYIVSSDLLLNGNTPAIRFGTEVENLPGNPRGMVRLIQHAWIDNLLTGSAGVLGTTGLYGKLILAHPYASEGVVDSSDDTYPFYSGPGPTSVQNVGDDSPALPVDHPLIWPVSTGKASQIDIRFRYCLSTVWQFDDGTVYYLGNTWWNTRFQGVLTNGIPGITYQDGCDNRTTGDSGFTVDNADRRIARPLPRSCAEYVSATRESLPSMDNAVSNGENKQGSKENSMNFCKTELAVAAALAVGAGGGIASPPSPELDAAWAAYMAQRWDYVHGNHQRVFYERSNGVFQVGIMDWRIPEEMLCFQGVDITKEELPSPSMMHMEYVVYALAEHEPAPPSKEDTEERLANAKWEDYKPSVESLFVYVPPPKPVREVAPPLEAHWTVEGRVSVGFRLRADYYVMAEVTEEEVPTGIEIQEVWPWPEHIHPVVESPVRDVLVANWLRGAGGGAKGMRGGEE